MLAKVGQRSQQSFFSSPGPSSQAVEQQGHASLLAFDGEGAGFAQLLRHFANSPGCLCLDSPLGRLASHFQKVDDLGQEETDSTLCPRGPLVLNLGRKI